MNLCAVHSKLPGIATPRLRDATIDIDIDTVVHSPAAKTLSRTYHHHHCKDPQSSPTLANAIARSLHNNHMRSNKTNPKQKKPKTGASPFRLRRKEEMTCTQRSWSSVPLMYRCSSVLRANPSKDLRTTIPPKQNLLPKQECTTHNSSWSKKNMN